jgi:hypothetical protein
MVYLVYPDPNGWVVRPLLTEKSFRFATREQALLGARNFAGEAAARVVLFKTTGRVEINYHA